MSHRLLITFTVAALLVSAVFAEGGREAPAAAGKEGPTKLSMLLTFDGLEMPPPGNEIQKMIEQYTNTQLEIKAYPWNTVADLYTTGLAARNLPDVITLSGGRKDLFVPAVRDGVVWTIDDALPKYAPKLSKHYHPAHLENISVDGKIPGLPKVRPLARRGFIYRKDWAVRLGLKEPKTTAELYDFLKAMTTRDPDGDGKDDTYGIVIEQGWIPTFMVMAGAPNKWEAQAGQFVRDATTNEYMEGMKFVRRLYQEKIMHPDFTNTSNKWGREWYSDERAASMIETTIVIMTLGGRVLNNNPKAVTAAFPTPAGPKGIRAFGEAGNVGIIMFNKLNLKTEAQLGKALSFFEKTTDRPLADLFVWGLEGTHFSVKDGKAVAITEKQNDLENRIQFSYKLPLGIAFYEDFARPGVYNEWVLGGWEVDKANLPYMVTDPSRPLVSTTDIERGNQLEKVITDATAKYIAGKINEDEFKAEVKKYMDTGGTQIAKELAADWARIGKK